MVDESARKSAGELISAIEVKNLTNWQLEELWPESKSDPALNCIHRWLWTLYDDGDEIVLKDLFDEGSRLILERCLNFLASDIEFELTNVTKEEEAVIRKKWGKEWCTGCTLPGNNIWPFPRK